jgi:hypothetical protein
MFDWLSPITNSQSLPHLRLGNWNICCRGGFDGNLRLKQIISKTCGRPTVNRNIHFLYSLTRQGWCRLLAVWGRVYSACLYWLDIVVKPAPTELYRNIHFLYSLTRQGWCRLLAVWGRVYSACLYWLDIIVKPAPTELYRNIHFLYSLNPQGWCRLLAVWGRVYSDCLYWLDIIVKPAPTELYRFPIPTNHLPIISPNISGKFKGEFNGNRV